ncbi:MAG: hypothetical protein KKB51_05320 [Candidatus Riflebacteria bacterium]|nr:hypothetical protein [Candidatus Riflebacteria bacterium]
MSDVDCEKIIDQAVESGGTNSAVETHAKTCQKCASALALLALLKTSGSPTADIAPSAAFIGRIENSLTTSATGTGLIAALKPKILAAAIGVALTAAIALAVLSRSGSSDNHSGKTSVSSIEGQASSAGATDRNTGVNMKHDEEVSFPQLQFPSPTDEIK